MVVPKFSKELEKIFFEISNELALFLEKLTVISCASLLEEG